MSFVEDFNLDHFIRLHIQERDRLNYGDAEVAAHIRGLERIVAHGGFPENLTQDEWLHYVASPRINNEALTPWMAEFQAWLWDEVAELDTVSKILRVNEMAAAEVTYRSSNARTLPPAALKRGIYGRCGEESTFVTAALRAVGIPARQVYVPLWNHSDDNHAWVEAFDGDRWRFLGACEPEAVLDLGWFNAAARRAPLVVSRTQIPRSDEVEHDLGINTTGQQLINESHRYRKGALLKFSVPTEDKGIFAIHILNYSTLAPLLEVYVEDLNQYELALGPGTYHISFETPSARYATNFDLLSLGEQTVELEAEGWDASLEQLPEVWHAAAVSPSPTEITDEERTRGLAIRAEAAQKRQAKEDAQTLYAKTLAAGRSEIERDILVRSRGNADAVLSLLDLIEGDEAALQLLLTMAQKDLYELEAEEFFRELEGVMDAALDLEPKVRAETLLNPRVHAEDFSPYRANLTIEEKSPEQILEDMQAKYSLVPNNRAPYEPLTVLAAQSDLSLADFTKLLCGRLRAHGFPCVYKSDGLVEVYDDSWRLLSVSKARSLRLTSQEKDYVWRAGQNYQLLALDYKPTLIRSDMDSWQGSSEVIHLRGRKFGVMTTLRLPNGDQRSKFQMTALSLDSDEVTELELSLPYVTPEDLLIDLPLPSEAITQALGLPYAESGLAILTQGGNEPTEHAFEELAMLWDGLSTRIDKVTIYYDAKRDGALEALERSSRYISLQERGFEADDIKGLDYPAHLESLGRGLFVEPEALPLIMLYEHRNNKIHIRFVSAGYTVGLGERILNSLEEMKS